MPTDSQTDYTNGDSIQYIGTRSQNVCVQIMVLLYIYNEWFVNMITEKLALFVGKPQTNTQTHGKGPSYKTNFCLISLYNYHTNLQRHWDNIKLI